jgi:uncharacterized membrane protein YqhA
MSDMSPLGRFVLIAMLWGLRFAALAFVATFAIVIWQKWFSAAAAGLTRQDYTFLAIIAALFVGAVLFIRSVARELRK